MDKPQKSAIKKEGQMKSILAILVLFTVVFAAKHPDALTAYQAYVHNHTTTLLMDALTDLSADE